VRTSKTATNQKREESEGASGKRDDKAFGKQELGDPAARCADGLPNRDLALTALRACEEQIRNIR
jgi:hypothetical protein